MEKPTQHFIEEAKTLTLAERAWLLSEAYDMSWDYEHLGCPCSAHRERLADFMRSRGLNPFKEKS